MGALCCCPRPDDIDEYTSYSTGYIYQHCFCFRCCVRLFFRMYAALFCSAEGRDVSSAMQNLGAPSSTGLLVAASLDTSAPDTYRAPPRPLPYDTDPRYVRLQRDGLISRREKLVLTHLHVGETEPLRRTNSDCEGQMGMSQRQTEVDYGEQASEKCQSMKSIGRVESLMSLGDDEDICPTCLDGYNDENPKISTECGHSFHLSCIYEWMERSKHCPVCGKEMIFNETP
eukprot:c27683_g2_i1 orf=517-1203(+)